MQARGSRPMVDRRAARCHFPLFIGSKPSRGAQTPPCHTSLSVLLRSGAVAKLAAGQSIQRLPTTRAGDTHALEICASCGLLTPCRGT